MKRSEAIKTIKGLFPFDSDYPRAAEVGGELLIQAIQEIGWEELSDSILERYAELCIKEDRKQFVKATLHENRYGTQ